MSESKNILYADDTSRKINSVVDKFGWSNDYTSNFIQAQMAVNIAMLSDVLIAIWNDKIEREK